uniref:Uncharacterized protein n=1 Tax=Ditylenchus dipsaci TaxID=166011 RepID=A0A915DVF1_9BILA
MTHHLFHQILFFFSATQTTKKELVQTTINQTTILVYYFQIYGVGAKSLELTDGADTFVAVSIGDGAIETPVVEEEEDSEANTNSVSSSASSSKFGGKECNIYQNEPLHAIMDGSANYVTISTPIRCLICAQSADRTVSGARTSRNACACSNHPSLLGGKTAPGCE